MFCEYYGLHYHIFPIVIEYILRNSTNFYCNRKIKDVTNVTVQVDDLAKKIEDNNKFLGKISK